MSVHVKAVFTRAATAAEDVAITTHDFEGPDVGVTDLAGWLSRWTTWWLAIDQTYPPAFRFRELRFYNGYNGDGSPGEVDLVQTIDLPGVGGANMLPPQCACSVTEELYEGHLRRHWGRFYLPAPIVTQCGSDGRYISAYVNTIADATKALLDASHAAGWTPIVWVSAAGGGQAIVDGIRVDDIVDIQRRRRWDTFVTRVTRDLTTT
jgi:hypothetical protein